MAMPGCKRVRAEDEALARLAEAGLLDDAHETVSGFLPFESGGLTTTWHELPACWIPWDSKRLALYDKEGGAWWSVHRADGMEWRLCEGVYTLNGKAFRVPKTDSVVRRNLCAAKVPAKDFRDFRRTFRYWLIVAVARDGFLPYPQPVDSYDIRYDLMADHTMNLQGTLADEARVRTRMEGMLTPAEMDATWAVYRRAWARMHLYPALRACLFAVKMLARYRASFAPGGRGYEKAARSFARAAECRM